MRKAGARRYSYSVVHKNTSSLCLKIIMELQKFKMNGKGIYDIKIVNYPPAVGRDRGNLFKEVNIWNG